MVQTPSKPETLSLKLPREITLHVSQKQFKLLAIANRDLRLERTAQGELMVNPPTGGKSGQRNLSISGQLGTKLGWLIDPQSKRVEIYRAEEETEIEENPLQLSGEEVLPGFLLDLKRVWS